MKQKVFFLLIPFLFLGCEDKNVTITHYNKNINSLSCLSLKTNDLVLQMHLQSLYHFSNNCPYTLEASTKSAIVCNSNQNVDKKILANFPHGYFRLDIYGKKEGLIYSYYKDTNKPLSKEMIQEGFNTIKKEFSFF